MSKILININNLKEIDKYMEIGISNFLFAVSDLSIGYKSFLLKDIPYNSYLLINRIFDHDGIEMLKSSYDEIKKYRGIIFEDLGVFNLFKDEDIELIWYQNHFGTNYEAINYYITHGCKSAVISNEITKEEIKDILKYAKSPLILTVFAKNQIMYSRRSLLTNFNTYVGCENYQNINIYEPISKNNFLVKENEYGTVFFNNEYFNYLEFLKEIDEDKIYYYLILNESLSIDDIINILNGQKLGNNGFLDKKTVYRMSDYE